MSGQARNLNRKEGLRPPAVDWDALERPGLSAEGAEETEEAEETRIMRTERGEGAGRMRDMEETARLAAEWNRRQRMGYGWRG